LRDRDLRILALAARESLVEHEREAARLERCGEGYVIARARARPGVLRERHGEKLAVRGKPDLARTDAMGDGPRRRPGDDDELGDLHVAGRVHLHEFTVPVATAVLGPGRLQVAVGERAR